MDTPGSDVSKHVDIDAATIATSPTLGAKTHVGGERAAITGADRTSTCTTATTNGLGQHCIRCQSCGVDHHPQRNRAAGTKLHGTACATSAATTAFDGRSAETVLRGRFGCGSRHRTTPLAAAATDGLGVETRSHHAAGSDFQQAVCTRPDHKHCSSSLTIPASTAHAQIEATGVRLISFGSCS